MKQGRTKQEIMEEFAVNLLLDTIRRTAQRIAVRYAAHEMRDIARSFVHAVDDIQEARAQGVSYTLFIGRQLRLEDFETNDDAYGRVE